MVNQGTTVAFQWSAANASSYRLEIGSSSGGSDVATLDAGAATTATWTGAPVGNFYARVWPRMGTTQGAASSEVLVGSIDARQMIDALIFGRGPFAVAGSSWFPFVPDQMEGWQPGTTFAVIVGQSVPDTFATALEKTAQQVGSATRGAVQASVVGRQPEPLPSPGPGQVTVSVVSTEDLTNECQCADCSACSWIWLRGSFIQRGRILLLATAAQSLPARELGVLIGLGEIISAAGVRPTFTMGVTTDGKYLPSGQLSVLDPATIRMLETLYGMGLTAGSTRRQFEAAGLVPSAETAATAPAGRALALPGYRLRTEGLDTVVVKPVRRER